MFLLNLSSEVNDIIEWLFAALWLTPSPYLLSAIHTKVQWDEDASDAITIRLLVSIPIFEEIFFLWVVLFLKTFTPPTFTCEARIVSITL